MRNENSCTVKELIAELEFDIRFSETDAMGVVWHGNYLKYFEDGREAFAKKHGMSYLEIHSYQYFVPIVKSEINHKSPIYYGQRAKIITKMIPSKAAKIIFEYEIINLSTQLISAKGSTTQVFLREKSRELELQFPTFYLDWEKKVGIK
ncbi:MAG: 4-hydroxybenzoyl-CoA thioesterase [Flavobacteriales bacterium CG18_big_fil_WC_8_21_14_2_50_32_9]|nr:MAG: 4-hydroxybenzoyl-CoA thioesterase [Flavobacteriales bacterium CG18_big_fil_WC_8_21_14_2_50_32_9]PJC62266.1 MAG: 4-hydroxybenzoyl-CoA thioesterase [Flavobacteriales bacterium CG_4_9_14_0_2_um_filter_32_27]